MQVIIIVFICCLMLLAVYVGATRCRSRWSFLFLSLCFCFYADARCQPFLLLLFCHLTDDFAFRAFFIIFLLSSFLFIYLLFVYSLFFFFSTFFFFNCAYLCLHLFFIPYFLVYLTTKKRKVENTNRKSSLKGTDAIRSNLKEWISARRQQW